MGYEYVRVSFPDSRRVIVDDCECGVTEELLRVDRGTHRFRLVGDANYDPPLNKRVIAGTNPLAPALIVFQLKSQ